MGSICQIGVAGFADGRLVHEWSTLVDPEDYFDEINVSIHGIDAPMVKGAPTIPAIADSLREQLEGRVCVCHTHFDRIAVGRALERYDIPEITTMWLDSARVVRRVWVEFAWAGYGLASVCKKIGYEFKHHDALEDAKAAGHVLLAAMRDSGLDLEGWARRVKQPINPARTSTGAAINREGNPEGDLFGEVLVFTGALQVHRNEAADLAAAVGCRVMPNVTKATTILVVGDQDVTKLRGHEKSSKHRKAEQLAAQGHRIRIIRESDFITLARGHP
jgi:DNA polymerase-3 subunit epsilon